MEKEDNSTVKSLRAPQETFEKLKAIASEAKSNKAAAKAKLDHVREEMKAAGVYDKYKKFVEAIDGMCSCDKLDADDTNVD